MIRSRFLTGFFLGAPLALTVAAVIVVSNIVPGVFNGNPFRAQVGGGSITCDPSKITEFPVIGGTPQYIEKGPDGNIWFSGYGQAGSVQLLYRISPVGTISGFTQGLHAAKAVTGGPDGNIWFTEGASGIGKSTPMGDITEYPSGAGDGQQEITAGPDGNVWFTMYGGQIAKMTPAGGGQTYTLPGVKAVNITKGSDGNLWVLGENSSIARVTRDGVSTRFALPSPGNNAGDITLGPDNNVWFTEATLKKIGKITPEGVITEYASGTAAMRITAGPDGNLWFTLEGEHAIGRITTNGVVTKFPVSSNVFDIANGPDNNLWFTMNLSAPNNVSRLLCAGVGNGNHAPQALLDSVTTPKETPVTIHVLDNDTDQDGDVLTITSVGIPANGSARINADKTVTFTPNAGYVGQESFIYTIADTSNVTSSTAINVVVSGDGGGSSSSSATSSSSSQGGTGQCNNPVIDQYNTPTASALPLGIVAGFDGNMWFTEKAANKVARVTPTGDITEFALPVANSQPYVIAQGSDSRLWFTNWGGSKPISAITMQGVVTNYPQTVGGGFNYGIAKGPDGNIWETASNNVISKVSTSGTVQQFTGPFASTPTGIVSGPGGALWFNEPGGNIGRITTSGTVTEFPTPADYQFGYVTVGSDGNIWFADTQSTQGKIGKMTPTGQVTEYDVDHDPIGVTLGPDGNIWYAGTGTNGGGPVIGRITPAGVFKEFTIPNGQSPWGIAKGADGNIWFTGGGATGSWVGVLRLDQCGDGTSSSAASSATSSATSSAASATSSSKASSTSSSSVNPDVCMPICGDGLKVGFEECDDGNTKNGDGCSSVCKKEIGSSSSAKSSSSSFSCPTDTCNASNFGGQFCASQQQTCVIDSTSATCFRCQGTVDCQGDVCGAGGTQWCAGLPPAGSKSCVSDPSKPVCFDCRTKSSSSSSAFACPANPCTADAKSLCAAQGGECVPDSSAAPGCFSCSGAYVCDGSECGKGGSNYCSAVAGKSCVSNLSSDICIDCRDRCPADPCGAGGNLYCSKYGKECVADGDSPACIDCQPEPPIECSNTMAECDDGGSAYCAGFGKICKPAEDGICIQCLAQGECTGTDYECKNGGQNYCSAVNGGDCVSKADGICISCSTPGPYQCLGNECRKGGANYCATLGEGCKNVPDGICISCTATMGCSNNLECAEGSVCSNGKCVQLCGNGRIDPGEVCDGGSGCTSRCLLAENQQCANDTDCESVSCKKGLCVPCTAGDQCQSNQCRDGACENLCGNGRIDSGEVCDPGLDGSSADCTKDCLRGNGISCADNRECGSGLCGNGACSPCSYNAQCGSGLCLSGACIDECGNGRLDSFEQCDDGNEITGDGCDRFCRRESTVAGELLPVSLLGDVTNGTGGGPDDSNLRGIAGSHAAAGQTGPAAVIAIAGGAAAGWSFMRKRRRKI